MMCQKNDKRRSTKRRKIVKKKSKTKFAGVTIEGVPTLWLELEIDVVSIVEDMKHSRLYVNCLSKHIVIWSYCLRIIYWFDSNKNVILL